MNYNNYQKHLHKLSKLEADTRHSCRAGAYYDEDKNRIIKYSYTGSNYAKWLKKQSRRRVRRRHDDSLVVKGNTYKKAFDYWWELF